MPTITESLHKLGLTENETKVYYFLSQTGKSTYTNVVNGTNLHKSLVALSLKSLTAKNLVEKLDFGAKQYYYFISNPEHLSERINAEITEKQDLLNGIMKELKISYKCHVEGNAKIIFYHGIEGLKEHWQRLCDKNVKLIRQIFNQDFVLSRDTKRREKDKVLKKLNREIIFTSKEEPQKLLEGEHYAPYSEWRDITAEIAIYENTVIFIYGKSKKKAFLIENPDITKTMTVLYNMAKKGLDKK